MRDIKFRAKRIDMDRWIYGQYFITPLTDENSGTTPDKGWFFLTGEPRHCIVQNMVCFVIDEKTLGQYTGLKDKNGKEIYEGDIVKTTNAKGISRNFEILWQDDRARFMVWQASQTNTSFELTGDTIIIFKIEVIGNVYDNPDL